MYSPPLSVVMTSSPSSRFVTSSTSWYMAAASCSSTFRTTTMALDWGGMDRVAAAEWKTYSFSPTFSPSGSKEVRLVLSTHRVSSLRFIW